MYVNICAKIKSTQQERQHLLSVNAAMEGNLMKVCKI